MAASGLTGSDLRRPPRQLRSRLTQETQALVSPDQTFEDHRDSRWDRPPTYTALCLTGSDLRRPPRPSPPASSTGTSCLTGSDLRRPPRPCQSRLNWAGSCLTGSDLRRPPRRRLSKCRPSDTGGLTGSDLRRPPRRTSSTIIQFAIRSHRIRPSKTTATESRFRSSISIKSHRIRPSKTTAT